MPKQHLGRADRLALTKNMGCVVVLSPIEKNGAGSDRAYSDFTDLSGLRLVLGKFTASVSNSD